MIYINFLLVILSFSVFSKDIVLVQQDQFVNTDCYSNDSCDLLEFNLKVSYGSGIYDDGNGVNFYKNSYMEGSFKVSNISLIRKFAVVQYINGCVFQSLGIQGETAIIRTDIRSRDFFGQKIPFIHKNWVIDSFDEDPIYSSYFKIQDRHALYKIKKDETKSVIFDDSKYFDRLMDNPLILRPIIHFSDMPTGSNYSKRKINSNGRLIDEINREEASMIFKTCIFKTEDVPVGFISTNTDSSKAIKCFTWSNTHKFNSITKVYESNNVVNPICTK